MNTFCFNKNILDIENINEFSELAYFLDLSKNKKNIIINLKNIKFFNASLLSIFKAILNKAQDDYCLDIKIIFNNKLLNVFDTNGFLDDNLVYSNNIKDLNDTYIVIKRFEKGKYNDFLDYMTYSLKSRHFSNDMLEQLYIQLGEIFNNFVDHSDSKYFYISGQFFPNKKYLDICLTDTGIGIAKLVKNTKNMEKEIVAIKWAFEGQNTTRQNFGGFGLKNLKKFIEKNKGKFIVYCNNIYYNVIENKYKEFYNEFYGTSIFIRLPML